MTAEIFLFNVQGACTRIRISYKADQDPSPHQAPLVNKENFQTNFQQIFHKCYGIEKWKKHDKIFSCFESKYKFFDWAIVGVFFDLLPTSIYKLILYYSKLDFI